MPTLNGQFDLSSVQESVALPGNTDVASFTDSDSTDTASSFTATIDWGDGTTTPGTVVGSNGNFKIEGGHTYADEGFFNATATVTRTADNSQLAIIGTVPVADTDTINPHAATITFTPNQPLTNVTVATFADPTNTQNVASDFIAQIDWGDGTTTTGAVQGSGGSFSVVGSHTYAAAGEFSVSVSIADDSPDAATGFIVSTAVSGFGGQVTLTSATEGTPLNGAEVATFADTSGSHVASEYTATINWGDGSTSPGTVNGSGQTFTVTGDHTYADEEVNGDAPLMKVVITRTADSATASATGTVAVADADVLTMHSQTLGSAANQALTNVTVATFSDSYTGQVASDLQATIDWGDGSTDVGTLSGSAGSFTVKGSHTYTADGHYNVNVSILDDFPSGEIAIGATTSTAIVGLAAGNFLLNAITEADTSSHNVATFNDGINTDSVSSFNATIDWGDGQATAGTITGASGSFTVSGIHPYADEGALTPVVTVTRIADGDTLTMTGDTTVGEADSFVVTTNNFNGDPGTAINNVPVATFTDSFLGQVAGDLDATIDWGDGTSSAGTVSGSSGSFTVTGSHTYTTGGNYTFNVSVADDAPGTATANANGTATINLAGHMVLASATEHTALPNNTPVASFSDSNGGDTPASFSATIDWGDGTTSAGTISGGAGTFTVSGGHTYQDEGNDQASVTLTRIPDQAKSTVSGAVAVAESDTLTPFANTFTAIAGTMFTGTVASFGIVSGASASDFLAAIDWGDGSTTAGTVSGGNGAIIVSGSHTYTTNGQKTVSVTATDDSPGTAMGTAHSIANVDARPVAQNGSASGNEDTPISGAVVATDADNTQAQLTYALAGTNGGAQHGTVSMDHHGNFTYTPAADYNGPDSFQFMVTDGIALSNTATESITVNPVDDAPVIVSDGGGDTATVSAVERTTAVTTVVATDIDSPTVTYAISGGSDAAKFHIDSATGALSFITAPNFDVAADSDHNNSYIVQVSASDGTLADNQTITVNVTDNPNITSTLHWMQSVDAGAHPAGWQPAGIGDFNADGTSDLAWFNAATGDIDIWKLSNGAWSASSAVGSHPAGYQPVGFGDYNGDGTNDVLWFNSTSRDVDLWKISNGQWAGSVDIGTHPAGYQPALSADFNGDGTSDIAWYNPTTNDIDIWKISNGQWAGSVDIGTHPAGYQPVLAGDFDGDGTSDIAWYNPTTHDLDIWLIKNGQWAGSVDVGTHPAGWQPLAAADFSQDGTSDIAWYNPATNDIDVWLIKNAHWSASFDIGQHPGAAPGTAPLPGGASGAPLPGEGSPPAAPQSVIAVGAGDFDHSGVNDIMWRDTGTQHIDNWLLAYS